MIKAAIMPGIQPQTHKIKTIKIEPQPLSKTAKGGHIIESSTLQKLIKYLVLISVSLTLNLKFCYIFKFILE